MFIVDSSVWIDYLNGVDNVHTEWLKRGVSEDEIGLSDIIFCEVLQGIRNNQEFTKVESILTDFNILSTGGTDLAVASAQNYRTLRQAGVTIRKTIDCLVATLCLIEGHSLLHRDSDFDHFERHFRLKVVHPPRMQ